MGFPGQEYWGGLPFPPPGDCPDPGTEPESLASPALAGGFFTTNTNTTCISITVLGINITQSYPMDGRVSLCEDYMNTSLPADVTGGRLTYFGQ